MAVGTSNFPGSLDTVVELVQATNRAQTTISTSFNYLATSIQVASTASFPASGIIVIEDEIIAYESKTATTFDTCTRGFEGTTAVSHILGMAVRLEITARSHNVLADAIIALQTKVGTGALVALPSYAWFIS
jgi:hypothetical protein